jgi:hypothetical protein
MSVGTLAWFAASMFAMAGIAEAEPSQPVAQRNTVLELFTSQAPRLALLQMPYSVNLAYGRAYSCCLI